MSPEELAQSIEERILAKIFAKQEEGDKPYNLKLEK
jgi:hypothetical protein